MKRLTLSLKLEQNKKLENTQKRPDKWDKTHATGSSAWSGRVIFARDHEPVHTRLEGSPTGPRLVIESETFGAILPASSFILELLAAKLKGVASA